MTGKSGKEGNDAGHRRSVQRGPPVSIEAKAAARRSAAAATQAFTGTTPDEDPEAYDRAFDAYREALDDLAAHVPRSREEIVLLALAIVEDQIECANLAEFFSGTAGRPWAFSRGSYRF